MSVSVASVRCYTKGAIYPISKHAVIGLTKSTAIEGGERNIRVNAILPCVSDYHCIQKNLEYRVAYFYCRGPTKTDLLNRATQAFGNAKRPSAFRSIQRAADASELSSVIVFLLSEETFVTGLVWPVDGGSLASKMGVPTGIQAIFSFQKRTFIKELSRQRLNDYQNMTVQQYKCV
jgi:NAD(P)-dependent dehydrogenase (short-subunit alcohol dehydrogenase family)